MVKEIIFLGRKEIMTMGTSPIKVTISEELWKDDLSGDELRGAFFGGTDGCLTLSFLNQMKIQENYEMCFLNR